jgi:hypothetical protein
MLDDLRKSVNSTLYERASSPLYGTFILSWLICNWRIIYLTIFVRAEDLKGLTKLGYIEKYLISVEPGANGGGGDQGEPMASDGSGDIYNSSVNPDDFQASTSGGPGNQNEYPNNYYFQVDVFDGDKTGWGFQFPHSKFENEVVPERYLYFKYSWDEDKFEFTLFYENEWFSDDNPNPNLNSSPNQDVDDDGKGLGRTLSGRIGDTKFSISIQPMFNNKDADIAIDVKITNAPSNSAVRIILSNNADINPKEDAIIGAKPEGETSSRHYSTFKPAIFGDTKRGKRSTFSAPNPTPNGGGGSIKRRRRK